MNEFDEVVPKSEKWDFIAESLYEISCYRYGVDKSNARLIIAVMIQAAKDLYNSKINVDDLLSAHEYFNNGSFEEDCKLLALQPDVTRRVLMGEKNANLSI